MYKNFIKRKIGYLVSSRTNKISTVVFVKNHKNSRGELAEWAIKSHKDGKILSSHKTKSEATKHLRDIEGHKQGSVRFGFFSEEKRKEIIVWIWLNGDKDKDQIKEIIQNKFNVSDQDAERLFFEAYPDGLDLQEEQALDNLDDVLHRVINMTPTFVSNAVDALTGVLPESTLNQSTIDPSIQNQINLVVGTILKRRNLI